MIRGWLDVADSAGNPMLASGSFDAPLFNIQINNDGAPQLGATPASWGTGGDIWLHPGETNSLTVPVWDLNGITDIETIEIDLASNHLTPVTILWNATTNICSTNEVFLEVESCILHPIDASAVFPTEGQFTVNFTLEWGFNPDVSLVRTPSLLLHDRSGQSNVATLFELDWKLTGPLDDIFVDGIRQQAGVRDTNRRTLQRLEQEYIGITEKLQNLTQFYRNI